MYRWNACRGIIVADTYVVVIMTYHCRVWNMCLDDVWRGIIVSDRYVDVMYDVALSCLTRMSSWCMTWHYRMCYYYRRNVWCEIIVSDTYFCMIYMTRHYHVGHVRLHDIRWNITICDTHFIRIHYLKFSFLISCTLIHQTRVMDTATEKLAKMASDLWKDVLCSGFTSRWYISVTL